MSAASTVSVSASKSTSPVDSSKSFRPVTAKKFCARLSKKFQHVDLLDFDHVTGKEWDTRAKVFIRQQFKLMFEISPAALLNCACLHYMHESCMQACMLRACMRHASKLAHLHAFSCMHEECMHASGMKICMHVTILEQLIMHENTCRICMHA